MATPSLADFETMFAYATESNPDITPDVKDKGQSVLIQMEKTPQVIDFCLSQFNAFQRPTSFSVAFKCIEYRLLYCFEETPPETWQQVYNLIFSAAISKISPLPDETKDNLAKAQSAFVMKAYPQMVGDIFNTIFQMDDATLLRFLASFCKRLIIPRPDAIEQFMLVKRALAEQQIIQAIFQKLKSGIVAQNAVAFTGFADFIRWLPDISWTCDSDLMAAIMRGMAQIDVAVGVIEVFTSLMTKNIPNEQKAEICAHLGILQHLANASNAPAEAKQLLMKAADCVERMGIALLKTPLLKDIHEVAVRFYMNPDKDVAGCLTTYLYLFSLENAGLAPAIFEMVMKRTQMEFQNDPLNPVGFFLMDNVRIISGLVRVSNQAAVMALIEQEAEKVNIQQNPAHASAVLFFVSECLRAKFAFSDFPAIFRKFMDTVFSAQPPVPENSWYIVFGFLRIIVFLTPDDARFRAINQWAKEFLEGITRFAVSAEVPPVIRQKFTTLLLMYARFWSHKTRVTSELVMNLLSLNCKELNSAAGAFLNGVNPATRGSIAGEALKGFASLLTNPTKETMTMIFSFLLEIRDVDQHGGEVIGQFLAAITPACLEDGELLGMLIRSAAIVKPQGFQMFLELVPKISSYTSLEKASEAVILWRRWAKEHPSEPASQTIMGSDWGSVALVFFNVLVDTYQSAPLLTDHQKASLALKQCCYAFCELLQSMPQELVGNIVVFIKTLISRTYLSSFILESVLPLISAIASFNPSLAVEQFTESTLLFLFNPDFNPLKKRSRAIDLLIQFHAKLSKQRSVYLAFSQLLAKTFKRFGAADDFVSRYFKTLEGDYRIASFQCQLLLMELTTQKTGLAELVPVDDSHSSAK